MLLTFIIIIVLLLAAVAGGYYGWCRYAQRDQRTGRHRMADHRKTTPSAA